MLATALAGACEPPEPARVLPDLTSSPLRITETMEAPEERAAREAAEAAQRTQAVAAGRATPATPRAGDDACVRCHPDSFSAIPTGDERAIAKGVTKLMEGLRDCLDRVGGQSVRPATILRFTDDGQLTNVRIDVGGYEGNECVRGLQSIRPPVSASRGTSMRCEYVCSAPARASTTPVLDVSAPWRQ